jgi:Mg-chelatase subunit ChlD
MKDSTSPTKHTLVILVLDKSGSMNSDRDAVISGFNEQVQTLKQHAADAGQTAVSLITFSDPASIETIYAHHEASAVVELTDATYRPNGSTALFDAINQGIDLAQTHPHYQDEDTAVLVLAFTDGQENASAKVTGAQLKARIQELEAMVAGRSLCLGPTECRRPARTLRYARTTLWPWQCIPVPRSRKHSAPCPSALLRTCLGVVPASAARGVFTVTKRGVACRARNPRRTLRKPR